MSHLIWILIAIATGTAGYFIGESSSDKQEIYEITGQTTALDIANAKNKGQKVTLLDKDWDSPTKSQKVKFPKVETQQIGKDVKETPDSQNPFKNGNLTRHYPLTDQEKAEEAGDY